MSDRSRHRDAGAPGTGVSFSRAPRRVGRALLAPSEGGRLARERSTDVTLIGLDVLRPPIRLKPRSWVPLAAALLIGALFLAVLRVDMIRIRFGLAESLAEELRLADLKRELTVKMRTLRDPAVLSRRARELGFERAVHLIELPASGAPLPLLGPDPAPGHDRTVEFAAVETLPRWTRP